MGTASRAARTARTGRVALWAAIVGLSLSSLAVLPASAAPTPSASNPPGSAGFWAFGGQRSVDANGTALDGNTSFTIHAAFGWNTVLRQINGTGGSFEIVGNRTVGASLFVTYCRPDCSNPLRTLNISERLWETELSFANLTASGTVYSGRTPIPALALLDSSVRAKGNLTESATAKVTGARAHTYSADQGLSISASAAASVSFHPALGLLPLHLNVSAWNSSAQYSAAGEWSVSVGAYSTSFLGFRSSNSQSYPGSFAGVTGNVTLSSVAAGNLTLRDGESAEQVGTTISGPFVDWDGFILVPSAAELLDPSASPWAGEQAGAQLASTARLDVAANAHVGRFPVLASMASYLPGATDSASPSLESGVSAQLTGSPGAGAGGTGPLDGPPPTSVQGQPENPAAANASSLCLITGCAGPVGNALPRAVVLAAALLVIVVVIAAAVVVKRQPPRHPPASPNSLLYPNGPVPAPAKRPVAPGEPPAADPLGHLW